MRPMTDVARLTRLKAQNWKLKTQMFWLKRVLLFVDTIQMKSVLIDVIKIVWDYQHIF